MEHDDEERENMPALVTRGPSIHKHSGALSTMAERSPFLGYSLIRHEQKNVIARDKEVTTRVAMHMGSQVMLQALAMDPESSFIRFAIERKEKGFIFSRSESWSFTLERRK